MDDYTRNANGLYYYAMEEEPEEVENPQMGMPQMGMPQVGTPQMGNSQMGTPQMGNSQMGNPQVGMPQMEMPQMETREEQQGFMRNGMQRRNNSLGNVAPGEGPMGFPTPSLPSDNNNENIGGTPQIPLPPIVGQPEMPEDQGTEGGVAGVRILNAAANYGSVSVTIGEDMLTSGLPFGSSTRYRRVREGFRVVTVSSSTYPRHIIYRQVLPFVAGIRVTLALVNSANGLGIQMITDLPCFGGGRNLACLRMVNLSYNSGPLELVLEDGRVVFSDVRFKEVTSYKRANEGKYNFKVVNSPNRPMPIVSDISTINDLTYQLGGTWNALLEFSIDMKANTLYTVYILGNDGYVPSLQPYILEN